MSFFVNNAQIINSKLQSYFELLLSDPEATPKELEIINHLKEFTLRGGKRIRASLVEVGYKLYSKTSEINEKTLKTLHQLGIVMELLQSFFLIHDDIIDKAPLRRGLETLHLKWAKQYGDDLHMGESMAILAGNYALIKAYKVIQTLVVGERTKLAITGLVHQVIQDTLAGQIIDVEVAWKKLEDTLCRG